MTALCVQLEGGYPEILSQRKQGRGGEWEGRGEGVGGGKERQERGGRLDGKEEVWIWVVAVSCSSQIVICL